MNPTEYNVDDDCFVGYGGEELREADLLVLGKDHDDQLSDGDGGEDRSTSRFSVVAYTDASFAVNELKQSISGWVVYVNGTPIVWGSQRQTVVVDSSCSAEYVAASICLKQIKAVEHALQFLDVWPLKPFTVYTDSQATMHIGTNTSKLGKVRYLAIRTHVVRCYVSIGDVKLLFCVTEDMVADLMTKIVSGAQEEGLFLRFYNDAVVD